jgi:hypothetical protein
MLKSSLLIPPGRPVSKSMSLSDNQLPGPTLILMLTTHSASGDGDIPFYSTSE